MHAANTSIVAYIENELGKNAGHKNTCTRVPPSQQVGPRLPEARRMHASASNARTWRRVEHGGRGRQQHQRDTRDDVAKRPLQYAQPTASATLTLLNTNTWGEERRGQGRKWG